MVKNTYKVLKTILEHQNELLNINTISKLSKLDYKNTYNIIKDLEEKNVIYCKIFGKSKIIFLNKKINPLLFETEYNRRKEFLQKNKKINLLYEKLLQLNFPFIILIFGSKVKKQYKKQNRSKNKNSDIDFLIITEEKYVFKIKEILELYPINIHPTFINYEEFVLMLKNKEFSVVSEAIKQNIILFGIEEYYEILQNL